MQEVHSIALAVKCFRDDTEVEQLIAVRAMLVAHLYNQCMLGGRKKNLCTRQNYLHKSLKS